MNARRFLLLNGYGTNIYSPSVDKAPVFGVGVQPACLAGPGRGEPGVKDAGQVPAFGRPEGTRRRKSRLSPTAPTPSAWCPVAATSRQADSNVRLGHHQGGQAQKGGEHDRHHPPGLGPELIAQFGPQAGSARPDLGAQVGDLGADLGAQAEPAIPPPTPNTTTDPIETTALGICRSQPTKHTTARTGTGGPSGRSCPPRHWWRPPDARPAAATRSLRSQPATCRRSDGRQKEPRSISSTLPPWASVSKTTTPEGPTTTWSRLARRPGQAPGCYSTAVATQYVWVEATERV